MTTEFEEKIEKEKREAEEKRKLQGNIMEWKRRINEYLVEEKYVELLSVFQDKEVVELAKVDNTLAVFSIVLSIYGMEIEEGISGRILDGIHDIQKAEEVYLRIKFLIWRLEFQDEKEELKDGLCKYHVSFPFLKHLIHASSFEKANTAFKLAMLLKEEKCLRQAFEMLQYVNDLSPNEEIVFCEMADICMQTGQYQMAADCIGKIQNPSGLLVSYERKWGI